MYRLMLIDDEPWALSGLEELIPWERFGFSIIGKYTDPENALQQIYKENPDAIITDVRMPKLSGIELMSKVKKDFDKIEVILLSAYRDFEAVRNALKYGAFQYILKPFNQTEVEETIRMLAEKLRGTEKIPSIDPEDPEWMSLPQIDKYLRAAAPYPFCFVCLSDCSETVSQFLPNTHITTIDIVGVTSSHLISAPSLEMAFRYISELTFDPVKGVGFSRVYPSFSSLREMLREARHSLENGFVYAKNPLASNMQLYICNAMANNLSLSNIASAFYLTETYISSMFKKNTGSTLTSFIQDIHIYRAARLILRSDMKLQEISEYLGYTDYSYFGKLFKRRFGISPTAYRSSVKVV